MLDLADIGLLFAAFTVMGTYRAITERRLRKDAAKVQKYKLYKVRDDLIMLVARGLLKKDTFIFKTYYEAIESVIARSNNRLTLRKIVALIIEMEGHEPDPASEKLVKRVRRALEKKDPAVRDVVNYYYQAVAQILVENSALLRFYVFINRYLGPLRRLWIYLDSTKTNKFLPRRDVWRSYRRYAAAGGFDF